MRKIYKKIISCIMLMVMFITNLAFSTETVEASSVGDQVTLLVGQSLPFALRLIGDNNQSNYGTEAVYYTDSDGNKQYAYCVEPNKWGVENSSLGTSGAYHVNLESEVSEAQRLAILQNGFPTKTPAEMGLNTEEEAYLVTKMALYNIVYANYSGVEKWEATSSSYDYVYDAFVSLVGKASTRNLRSSVSTRSGVTVMSDTTETIKDEGMGYLVQTFSVGLPSGATTYTITLDGSQPSGTRVVDMSNNDKTTFNAGEQFKVLVPIINADQEGSFNFNVSTDGSVSSSSTYMQTSAPQSGAQKYIVTRVPGSKGSSGTGEVNYYEKITTETTDPDPETSTVGLKIVKLEAGTTTALAGAEFKVVDADGGVVGVYYTDSSGEINISDLPLGSYYVEEITPPDGYSLDRNYHKDIELTDDRDEFILTFENYPLNELSILKVDADTNETLSGASFTIVGEDNNYSTSVTTGADGKATILDLEDGVYTVTEIVAPDGYVLNNTPQTITLEKGKEATLTFSNYEKPGLIIKKYDEKTSLPLGGAEFSIAKKGGSIVYEGVTPSDGIIRLEDLEEGWYTITEIAAPDGYLIATESKDVYVEGGKVVEVKFDNRLKPALQIMKIDSETKAPLEGAVFDVQEIESGKVSQYITDSNGIITILDLEEEIYKVTEVSAPTNYILNTISQDILLEWGTTKTLVFENTKKPNLVIEKYDEATAELLPNAEFSIKNKDTNKIIFEGITDSNGQIGLENLEPGWYTITELAPPEKYMFGEVITKDVYFDGGENTVIKFDNRLKPSLEITKIDGETSEPLPNTTFKVEKEDGSFSSEFTTDENGKILLENIEEGVYKVTEIIAPSGYVINSVPKTINLKWQSDNTFIHTLIFENYTKPSLIVEKYDEMTNELLPNAQFKIEGMDNNFVWEGVLSAGNITDGSTQEVIGTLEDGRIVINGLDEGTYKITELNPPKGYTFSNTTENPRTVVIEQNKTTTVKIDNRPLPDLSIIKKDSETNELLPNATFEIRKTDGEFVAERQTDENGQIYLTDIPEGTYTITEVSAPTNYILNTDNSRTIQIKWNGGDKGDGEYEVIFENTLKPTIVINKLSALGGFGLSGAKFEVQYRQNDGGLKNLGTFTTNDKGQIVLRYVDAGWYMVTEVKAPIGYQLPSNPTREFYLSAGENSYTPIEQPNEPNTGDISVSNGGEGATYTPSTSEVAITYGSQIPEIANLFSSEESVVYSTSIDYDNYPLNSIVIKKTDSLTGQMLQGATFELIKVAEGVSGSGGTTIGTYTTDYTGVIVITGLQSGHYIVRETKAPINYDLNITNDQQAYLAEDGTSVVELMFNNSPYGRLVINKMDTDTKEPLSGAIFEITNSKGEFIGSGNGHYTTDIDGVITLDNLPPDSYVVTEIKAPTNYAIDQENNTKIVDIGYGDSKEVNFYNKAFSTLIIRKLDTDTKDPLSGAEFKVTNADGTVVGDSNGIFVTNNDGLITINDIPVGSYIVTEIKAPTGYILDENNQTVEVKGNTIHTLDFYNTALSSLVIRKLDTDTKEPLSGAEFKITNVDGTVFGNTNGIYVTDNDGLITINDLPKGSYIVTEIKAPTNYILDDTNKTIEINGNTTHRLDFYNTKMSSVQIIKIDSETKEPLKDAQFKIYKANGELVGTYTTDGDGLIILPHLNNGWYKAIETKAPTGYLIDDTAQDFEVIGNQFVKLTFENKKLTSLIIKKVAESDGSPLSGAEFKVTKQDGTLVGTYTTGADGLINISELTPDWYIISEIKAPSGYLLDETPKTVEVKTNVPTEVVFANKLKSGLQIIKIDSITGEPLSGAIFTVYKKTGDVVGTYTTDENGVIIVDGLENGWYKFAETKAPIGYKIDETPKDVEMKGDEFHKITFANTPLGSLKIVKINSNTGEPIANVEFEVAKLDGEKVLNEANGTKFVTDTTGQIYIPNLEDGTYTVTETKQADGYSIDETPKNVIVKAGTPTILEVPNTPLGGLRIVKTNATTGAKITGVEFEITKSNGEKVLNNTNGTIFTTDTNGEIYLPNLASGNYNVTETKEADGYFIDTTPKNVTVVQGELTELKVENIPASGLVIIKTDEMTGRPLQGVEFDVLRADGSRVTGNILDQNQLNTENNSPNKNINGNGAVNGSYVTDSNGRIYLNHLAIGEYHVVETKALDGYELDETVHSVTVREGIQETLKITNRQKAGLRIKKVDSFTGLGIYNVEFMIFDKNGNVVKTLYTDNNGEIDIKGLLDEETYTIRETRPADGYYTDDVPRTIKFESGKYTEIVWENTPQMGQIQIYKTSADNNAMNGLVAGTPLEGAIFEVYNYRNNNLVDRFITSKSGYGVSSPLPLGRYIVKEVKAPDNYSLSKEVLDVEIEFATQILKLDFTNESLDLRTSIRKTGLLQVIPNQDLEYSIFDVANNSTVSLDSFYWRDTLPNSMRATRLETGTYNMYTTYKLVGRTNKGREIIIVDNISSLENRTIFLSYSSVGLASDEYLLDITAMFGTVNAGFKMTEGAKLVGKTVGNIPHEYEFANKVDVGGLYGNEWVTSNDTWVTSVFNPVTNIPKTGY